MGVGRLSIEQLSVFDAAYLERVGLADRGVGDGCREAHRGLGERATRLGVAGRA
jgi:hypothetical protein